MPQPPARAIPLVALLLSALPLQAQAPPAAPVTPPVDFFGHVIGADYVLPDYEDFAAYWRLLDSQSERIRVVSIGTTAEGRDQLMAVVSSPANLARLEEYRTVARRMALAEDVSPAEAERLAAEGRAVVWIDGGLHATEVLGPQQLLETVYQLVSRDDDETRRILDDVIVLAVHANPDGMQLVSDWYMREEDPEERSTEGLPRLYQKYAGHDNNRDFFASTQPETENMNRVLFREWFPQIVYNHHQTGPTGTVLFAPPFRDPFNYVLDPLVITTLDAVGAAMHGRFVAEGKPGATMREGASYSTWWNGGLRTITYFHNMIGLLTETIGHPTPITVPFLAERQRPSGDLPSPVEPQRWHFRQSVDYSVTANYAVLDYASRHRDRLLLNIWRMGRNAIEAGGRDHWTFRPSRLAQVEARLAEDLGEDGGETTVMSSGTRDGGPELERSLEYVALLRLPELRDPRGYILPADQPDFPTAVKFVNALLENGIAVRRATADFEVAGERYPAGSYIVQTAQAFRPHVLDMFEPQDHPDDFAYPGGPPIPPYDNAGWTLALQMGIEFDRVLEGFDGPFERVTERNVSPPPGRITGPAKPAGWLLGHEANDAFIVVNRLLAAGRDVFWLTSGDAAPAGTFYIPAAAGVAGILERAATELGLDFRGLDRQPKAGALRLRSPRIALWDRYGGSMASGWTRWILERFEFPFTVVYPPDLDGGELRDRFDVLLLPDGAVSARDRDDGEEEGGDEDRPAVPPEYEGRRGSITAERTVPELRDFLETGGTVVAVGRSTALAELLGLPVRDALVDDAGERPGREEYYVPGSILEARFDTTHPLAHGLRERVDVHFNDSPVFRLPPGGDGLRRIAWFDTASPLRSGWAWGQERLEGAAAVVEAEVGDGRLYLFGPLITRRAQPHGTFKLLFNAIHLGAAGSARLR